MAKKKNTATKKPKKRVLQPSSSKVSKSKLPTKSAISSAKGKEKASDPKPKETTRTLRSKAGESSSTSRAGPSSLIPRKAEARQVLSDEENGSSGTSSEEVEESDPEDADRQLGLRRTLRVVSKATVRKSWKPINIKTRTHIQGLVTNLFPAAISRAKGEKKKIAVQIALNRLMQKVNDCLSELDVPPSKQGISYPHLSIRNKELEAMLVPDLEHIRDLELRLEQEQILAKRDEEELENFKEKKKALDSWTHQLYRSKLHPELRDRKLPQTMSGLCKTDNDFSHLSAADQRLMNLMPTSRDEGFTGADVRDSSYNPDQDVRINKISKRLGTRLSAVEQNNEGLDPFLQLVAAARSRTIELSNTAAAGTTAATSNYATHRDL
ncbi:hypothetical protein B0O80DRAFT_40592 [Mortierella sp. GBAus27b]|nr:hypothetical protein BGX31_009220 [Mortierella sp. GBA43]KAI8355308.1 hypothetical protein B0O80DRAFT_40592 [Mortierella sp. GBAus27b]